MQKNFCIYRNICLLTTIDKLWDHANLAQAQADLLSGKEDDFKARFDKNLIPFKADFSREMNMQFISLIAIFTALSFIVFGGISSLDNIFVGAKSIPIIQLLIIGSIWSLCISNLVFVFMFFISKLTKLPIKSSNKPDASISEKYPFVVWCNYIILLILACTSWLYYIDYSGSGAWILTLSRNNDKPFIIIGTIIIVIFFSELAKFLLKKRQININKEQEK